MEKIILEAEVLEVKNPFNVTDINNFSGMKNGMYAVFDGFSYMLIHWFNGTIHSNYIIPSKYVKHEITVEKQTKN